MAAGRGPPALRAAAGPPGPDGRPERSGGGSQRSGVSSQPFSAGEKSSGHSSKRIYSRASGHLRTWVLQPAGLHRGQPSPPSRSPPGGSRRLAIPRRGAPCCRSLYCCSGKAAAFWGKAGKGNAASGQGRQNQPKCCGTQAGCGPHGHCG